MNFNQELFNQLAKEYALPQTLKSAILGEDGLPEDFDAAEALKIYVEERKGFYKDLFREEIVTEYKEGEGKDQYIATIKPLRNRIIKNFGLTEDEVKDVSDIKQLIDLAQAKAEKQVQEQSNKSAATIQAELKEVRTKYAELHEEHEGLKQNTEARINTIEEEKRNAIHSFKVNNAFSALLDSDEFQWAQPKRNVERLLRIEMEERGYKVDFTPDGKELMIYANDGTKAFTLDGKDQYKGIKPALSDLGAHLSLFKQSNGGEGGDKPLLPGERVVNGKKVSNKGVSFLREQMGVS